jgi:hypothetical protein
MRKREILKSPEYFSNYITFLDGLINDMSKGINDPKTDEDLKENMLYATFSYGLDRLIMKYSQGIDIELLKPEFRAVINALRACQGYPEIDQFILKALSNYVMVVWVISLAILLEITNEEFTEVVNMLCKDKTDPLLDALITSKITTDKKYSEKLIHPKPYQYLLAAILENDADKKEENCISFLKNYYKSMRKCYWYDRHKSDDSQFFGYWSFELAAVVKLYGINDESFKDDQYYPRDLTGKEFIYQD